jgi:hypothetical protein
MSLSRISAALRREVRERARECCEYCLLTESQAFFPHEPDHLIARKHGGKTVAENLALACFDCNRFKGADIASIDGRHRCIGGPVQSTHAAVVCALSYRRWTNNPAHGHGKSHGDNTPVESSRSRAD